MEFIKTNNVEISVSGVAPFDKFITGFTVDKHSHKIKIFYNLCIENIDGLLNTVCVNNIISITMFSDDGNVVYKSKERGVMGAIVYNIDYATTKILAYIEWGLVS